MKWINLNNQKRRLYLLFSLLAIISFLLFLIVVIFENTLAKKIIDSQLEKLLPRSYYDFYQAEYKNVNHLRELQLNRYINGAYDGPTSLLYSKIGDGNLEILIQGDSWAEQFIHSSSSKDSLNKFSKENDLTFLLSGISSYAPSPMTAQLNVLRKKFYSKPEYIIALIDQTDIGDELCRYKNQISIGDFGLSVKPFDDSKYSEVYSTSDLLEDITIYYGNNYNFKKLLLLAKNEIKRKFRVKIPRVCTWRIISQPLYEGITNEQRRYLLSVIDKYISTVFEDNKVKKLMIMTFPHRKHLSGEYKFDVLDLMLEAINNSTYRNKIINYRPPQNLLDKMGGIKIYQEHDQASHLTDEAHNSILTKELLNELLQILKNRK